MLALISLQEVACNSMQCQHDPNTYLYNLKLPVETVFFLTIKIYQHLSNQCGGDYQIKHCNPLQLRTKTGF